MMKSLKVVLLIAVIAMIGTANAANLVVDSNISTATTWYKSDSPVHLVGDIYVLSGASLTIEPGVVVASYVEDLGSLAICQGAKIYVNGTKDEPVIMTSAEDVATWEGSQVTRDLTTGDVNNIITMGDPKTGAWRPACNEWGSLAVMGNAYISGSHYKNNVQTWTTPGDGTVTNTMCPSAMNKKKMEGLATDGTDDTLVLYGGGNDDDDSGSISYLSIRYGGRDLEPNKELNGLSMGGIGRATDVDHIEIMNNKDDGIETWGGTVEYQYVTIWNVGDDSFDVDEGWRGSVENAFIVQGYSGEFSQGSGMGDNAFEIDGAEDSNAQPVTTARVSKATVIGQPGGSAYIYDDLFEEYNIVSGAGSDAGTAWRDNARVQYDNCIWMDIDGLIVLDNADGDGANGYNGVDTAAQDDKGKTGNYRSDSLDGTLSWYEHWTTSYNDWINVTDACDPIGCGVNFAAIYGNYISTDLNGNLCQITDSVYYNDADNGGEMDDLENNNSVDFSTVVEKTSLPIQRLVRGDAVNYQDPESSSKRYHVAPVTFVNPLPADDITAGAFSTTNWLAGWTAAYAYGMTAEAGSADLNYDGSVDFVDLGTFSSQWLQ